MKHYKTQIWREQRTSNVIKLSILTTNKLDLRSIRRAFINDARIKKINYVTTTRDEYCYNILAVIDKNRMLGYPVVLKIRTEPALKKVTFRNQEFYF
jgi:hypothetical protein